MTDYEFYQHQKNFCEIMGAQKHIDANLRTFYAHAAKGFEIKLNKMILAQAAGNPVITTAQQKLLFRAKEA